MKYRPEIDGLRAVAVVAVVLYHLDLGVPAGYLGVDIFFVISGYLITQIISTEMQRSEFTIAGFYERRVRRIFPALFVMLAVVLLVGWFVLLPRDYKVTMRDTVATTLFGSNVLTLRSWGYFEHEASLDPLLHTWSLAVEEQFYLFFPLLLLLAHRLAPKRLRRLCVIAGLVSLVGAAYIARRSPNAVFYLTPFRAWELLAGSYLALGRLNLPARQWHREALGAAGMIAMLFPLFHFSSASGSPENGILAVLGVVALIYSSSDGQTFASRILSIPAVRYVGAISYSLYLWHWPFIVLSRFAMGLHPGRSIVVGMLIGAFALAVLSYHFVEQPFRRRRVGTSRGRMFAMGAVAMLLMTWLGTVGWLEHGFPRRFDARIVRLDAARMPVIPYKECIKSSQSCILGDQSMPGPTVLIWGDSHALQWASTFDLILKQMGKSAYLIVDGACPPLLGVHASYDPTCFSQNIATRDVIDRTPGLTDVVLAARWNFYFGARPGLLFDDDPAKESAAVATGGMLATLRFLKGKGLATMMLGDVPGARDNVPLSMALTIAHGTPALQPYTTIEVRARDLAFSQLASAAQKNGLGTYVDVLPWFCGATVCGFESDGSPLYRDDNHLSASGANSRAPLLASALDRILNGEAAGKKGP